MSLLPKLVLRGARMWAEWSQIWNPSFISTLHWALRCMWRCILTKNCCQCAFQFLQSEPMHWGLSGRGAWSRIRNRIWHCLCVHPAPAPPAAAPAPAVQLIWHSILCSCYTLHLCEGQILGLTWCLADQRMFNVYTPCTFNVIAFNRPTMKHEVSANWTQPGLITCLSNACLYTLIFFMDSISETSPSWRNANIL